MRVRARTEITSKLSARFIAREAAEYPPEINEAYERPRVREECGELGGALDPCPFLGCKYHLAIDVDRKTGSIKYNHPGKELWELDETCALKVADYGGLKDVDVGRMINVVREGAGIIVDKALVKLKSRLPMYREYATGEVAKKIKPESNDVSGVKHALVQFLKENDTTYGDDAEAPSLRTSSTRTRRRK